MEVYFPIWQTAKSNNLVVKLVQFAFPISPRVLIHTVETMSLHVVEFHSNQLVPHILHRALNLTLAHFFIIFPLVDMICMVGTVNGYNFCRPFTSHST